MTFAQVIQNNEGLYTLTVSSTEFFGNTSFNIEIIVHNYSNIPLSTTAVSVTPAPNKYSGLTIALACVGSFLLLIGLVAGTFVCWKWTRDSFCFL